MNRPADSSPRVTIGMPVYNGEDYVSTAIESVLDQTFESFEFIISDNASTDATESICRSYAASDERITYIRQNTNVGAARNFNLLVDAATTPYFRWACHDDVLRPRCVEAAVQVLDNRPDVVLAHTESSMIDGESQPYPRDRFHVPEMHLMQETPHARFEEYMLEYVEGGMCNPLYGVVRTEALSRTAQICSYPASDLILLGEIALLGKMYRVEEDLFFRRYHEESSTVANESVEEMVEWFNPGAEKKNTSVYLRHVKGYLGAINRHLSLSPERFRCYEIVLRKYVRFHRQEIVAELRDQLRQKSALFSYRYSKA